MLTRPREMQGFTDSLAQHIIPFTLCPRVRGDGVAVAHEVSVIGGLLCAVSP